MSEPDTARDYAERDVEAAYSVLIELGQVLGAWREKFVIVGGAVPWLLLGEARPKHVGTLDIDLDLDPEALAEGEYASLVEALERKEYERGKAGLKPFQLRRWVKVDEGDPVGVLVDLLMPRGAKGDQNEDKLVEGLRVHGADGGGIALAHHVTRKFEGTMPDGRRNEVELLVATIPAFLAMKGYALVGRDKKKDAYDIYFSARNFAGGPMALAVECVKLLGDAIACKGYELIAAKFRHAEDFGPKTVRLFLVGVRGIGRDDAGTGPDGRIHASVQFAQTDWSLNVNWTTDAPRLHRRPTYRAARHRVVGGVGLANGVGDGGGLWCGRDAQARDERGNGAGAAAAQSAGEAESRASARAAQGGCGLTGP